MHRLTWYRKGTDTGRLREYFLLALIASGASVTLQDRGHRYIFIANLPPHWLEKKPISPDEDPDDVGLFGAALGADLIRMKKGLTLDDHQDSIETERADGTIFRFDAHLVETDENGPHLLTTITDLTEERRHEEVLRALLLELSHRSKNLLAIIQSVASHTARRAGTVDDFLQTFLGRLHALARAQDLITDSSWQGARFRDLLRDLITAFRAIRTERITLSGADPLLPPNAALHIGLALHELAANAVAHGQLVTGRGTVSISLTPGRAADLYPEATPADGGTMGDGEGDGEGTAADGGAWMTMTWDERNPEGPVPIPLVPKIPGPKIPGPNIPGATPADRSVRGFGGRVLESVVPAAVNGRARLRIGEGGVRYRLTFPLKTPRVTDD